VWRRDPNGQSQPQLPAAFWQWNIARVTAGITATEETFNIKLAATDITSGGNYNEIKVAALSLVYDYSYAKRFPPNPANGETGTITNNAWYRAALRYNGSTSAAVTYANSVWNLWKNGKDPRRPGHPRLF